MIGYRCQYFCQNPATFWTITQTIQNRYKKHHGDVSGHLSEDPKTPKEVA
jgi:hypothetical protein